MKRTIEGQADAIYADHKRQIYVQTDRMFAALMTVQWLAGILAALVISPRTWIGQTSDVHVHVWAAVFLGGAISIFPIGLAILRPGESFTRYSIAIGQMLMSSLLIHLTGGRIETHFHVFGSLAFLSFYRDWRVLLPATVLVALDHLFRGIYYPQSVFGVMAPDNLRWLEHAGWVIFEDIFLTISCIRGQREMRKIAENTAELDANEARYRIVTNSASDAIITVDRKGKILFANQTAESTFGYSVKELLGRNLTDLVAEDQRRVLGVMLRRRILTGKSALTTQTHEIPAKHKDGREILIEVSFGAYDSDGVTVTTAVGRDITERKRAEDALRRSEEYRNLFKLANDAIIIFEPKTETVLDVNDYACKMYGYEREEFIGQSLKTMSEDADRGQAHIARLLNQGALEAFESIQHRSDGSAIHVLINSSIIEFDGKPAVLSINRDVTARLQADLALRSSEYKFRTLIENMGEGLVHVDENDRIVFTNRRFCEMTGYREDELMNQYASRLLLDDEGRKTANAANLRRKQGISESYELRLRTSQGKYIWTLVGAVPIQNAAGKVVGAMSVHSDITDRKRAEEQLIHNALHDPLTGLPNRGLFLEHLRRTIGHSPRRKKTFAVLFIDFDGFKLINDSLGHMDGDKLLKMIAGRLESLLRGDDVVARLGGDEFTILLDDLTSANDVFFVVDRIRDVLNSPFDIGGRDVFITASVGIALRDPKYLTPEEMLRDADIAMYRAKSAGKGRHEIYSHTMHEEISSRLRLETELRLALEKREFKVVYQPIMEIASRSVVGYEALVRWNHPERGLIMPGEFVPAAEETGLIVSLGEWVLTESCQQLSTWHEQHAEFRDLTMSVNLSCKQFMQPDLADTIDRILERTGLPPYCLRLEITESHVMENSDMAISIMNKLRELGVLLSIDDFGTGYSSLSYLQRLPINYLKIDRSFISLMNATHENGEIVRAIVMLAKNLNMQVIAEGIETEEQSLQLINLDCDFGQGYYYSRPVSADEAESMLLNRELVESLIETTHAHDLVV